MSTVFGLRANAGQKKALVTFPWVNLRAPALGSHACV